MSTGRAQRLYGGKNGQECSIPLSFFTFLSSGTYSLQRGNSPQSFVVKGTSSYSGTQQIFEGRFYLYETKNAIKVLNHVDVEDEEAKLQNNQSETIRKIRFVAFPTSNLILFDVSTGIKDITSYFNALLPSYFSSYPSEAQNLETIFSTALTHYQEPAWFLSRNKKVLKKIRFKMACTNLVKKDDSLFGGIKSKEDVIVDVTFSTLKRGGPLPEEVPEEFINLISSVGGESKFSSIEAETTAGNKSVLMSSVATFELSVTEDAEVYIELRARGEELIDNFEETLKAGYHG